MARSNTPLGMVLSNAPQALEVVFTLSDGQVAFTTLEPNKPYALMHQENGVAVLRQWLPGAGYAEAHLCVDDVHWTP